jgi:phospholipase C
VTPSFDSGGIGNGYALCEATYPTQRPPVPYGKQSLQTSLVSEHGFKIVRGQLTEGRFLVLEAGGYAITASRNSVSLSRAQPNHDGPGQRWVIHEVDPATISAGPSTAVKVTSAVDGRYVASDLSLTKNANQAAVFTVMDLGNGKGYSIQEQRSTQYLSADSNGKVGKGKNALGWKIYSVT